MRQPHRPPAPHVAPQPHGSPLSRMLLRGAGLTLVGLAAVGVVVPGLPTTPLLLVAAACFARSSPRLYGWLLRNRVFGPLIREWRATRTVRPRTKLTAITMIAVVGGASLVLFLTQTWARLLVASALLAVTVWIARLPSEPRVNAPPRF